MDDAHPEYVASLHEDTERDRRKLRRARRLAELAAYLFLAGGTIAATIAAWRAMP